MHPVASFTRAAAGALLLGALLSGCVTTQQRENDLAAAGFVARPASTPQRQAMLARLPPNKIVQRQKGNTITYAYADPKGCRCLYVGTQAAYAHYRQAQQAQRIADENEMAAFDYSDPAWDWGAWGPWGPEYGFGPGIGIGW